MSTKTLLLLAVLSSSTLTHLEAQKANNKTKAVGTIQAIKDSSDLAVITGHYLILASSGAAVMTYIASSISSKNTVKQFLNPFSWNTSKRNRVAFGALINLCLALSFAYYYVKDYPESLVYPFLKHATAYVSLCLGGASITFVGFLLTEAKVSGGFALPGVVVSLPLIALCIAVCVYCANYTLKIKQQMEKEAKTKEAAKKALEEEQKGFFKKIFRFNTK